MTFEDIERYWGTIRVLREEQHGSGKVQCELRQIQRPRAVVQGLCTSCCITHTQPTANPIHSEDLSQSIITPQRVGEEESTREWERWRERKREIERERERERERYSVR